MQPVVLVLALFLLLHLPPSFVDRVRSQVVVGKSGAASGQMPYDIEMQRLRSQIAYYAEWIGSEKMIREEATLLAALERKPERQPFFERRAREIRARLSAQLCAEPARVLCRDPASWAHTMWIERRPNSAILRESPVLAGGVLVGIVDWISTDRARVRLVTDSAVVPAVRAVRGNMQDRALLETIQLLRAQLVARPELATDWIERLDAVVSRLKPRADESYWAKGELCGAEVTGWRGGTPLLKGAGFNYEVADDEGEGGTPLVQAGDLLVTSGLDAVFPAGLKIAVVEEVLGTVRGPLQLRARSLATDLASVTQVMVLPPIGYGGPLTVAPE